MALRNAALGSIATTCTPLSQARDLASSHVLTPALPRPSTTPNTTPVSRSTSVVIHGSYRRHLAVSGSRKNRTRRYRCSSPPGPSTTPPRRRTPPPGPPARPRPPPPTPRPSAVPCIGPETGPAWCAQRMLSLIHISEPTRLGMISYAVFCL